MESASSCLATKPKIQEHNGNRRQRLLLFSARHAESLAHRVDSIRAYLSNNLPLIDDLSHTLSTKRALFNVRAFGVSDGTSNFEVSQAKKVDLSEAAPQLIWVFTGQGAQWPGMGKGLLDTQPVFRASIEALENMLSAVPDAPNWRLIGKKICYGGGIPLANHQRCSQGARQLQPAEQGRVLSAMLYRYPDWPCRFVEVMGSTTMRSHRSFFRRNRRCVCLWRYHSRSGYQDRLLSRLSISRRFAGIRWWHDRYWAWQD